MSKEYEGLVYPFVELNSKPDISFLNGLKFNDDYFVDNCIQQTKLSLDEKGAKVKSCAMGQLTKGSSFSGGNGKPPLVINRPFLFWVQRKSLGLPLFMATLNKDCWVKE